MASQKVLLCSDHLPPSGGGVEQVVDILARRLDSFGYDVAVFTLSKEDTPSLAEHDSIRLYEADATDLTEIIGLQSTLSIDALLDFNQILSEFDPDLIHVHNRFFFTSYVAGLLYSVRYDCPLVTTLHLGNIGTIDGLAGMAARIFEKSAARLLLSKSDHVIAVSEAVAGQAKRLGVPRDRLSVVRNAVELSDFPYSPPCGKDVVFIGRLVRNKGAVDFLNAAADLFTEHPGAHAHLVGTGPLRAELNTQVSDLGISESVTFHGFVDDIGEIYRISDVFCRPSYSEGLPLTVLESLASGVPPVVSDVAGVPEVVRDRETGVLVRPGDKDSISESLCWILDDESRLEQMGKRAREYAEDELSWEQRFHKVLSVYDSLLQA